MASRALTTDQLELLVWLHEVDKAGEAWLYYSEFPAWFAAAPSGLVDRGLAEARDTRWGPQYRITALGRQRVLRETTAVHGRR